MRITDFAELIRCMPYREQAFEVKKETWLPNEEPKKRLNYLSDKIDDVFNIMKRNQDFSDPIKTTNEKGKDSIMISRNDLFNATNDLELFVIQVLMWGYPTKGRGNNIDNFLEPENFKSFIEKLELAKKNKHISLYDIKDLMKNSTGLGFSTLSKILYFSRINYEALSALILDLRVINALSSGRYEDTGVENFKNLRYDNAVQNYSKYLEFMHSLAKQMNTDADRVEMFLFEFGSNLKELTGEEGDYSEL